MTRALLELEGLAIEIDGKELLSDVSLSVGPGACVGVVGETGCGKTLTCRFITGLLPRIGGRPIRGVARFDGVDLVTMPEKGWRRLRGRRIALVPQSSMSGLDPVIRVGGQLRETIRALDPEADSRARARELLDLVHLAGAEDVLRLYSHELSGGMRQRVMIALALAGRPDLLVADEATTALDVTVQRSILELLAELRLETGMALVLVTHDLALVQSVSDTVAIMYGGMVVESGRTAEVLSRPVHPYTQALLTARPGAVEPGARLEAIPGAPPAFDERPDGCRFSPRCRFAVERCAAEVPPVELTSAGHLAACWRAEEVHK